MACDLSIVFGTVVALYRHYGWNSPAMGKIEGKKNVYH